MKKLLSIFLASVVWVSGTFGRDIATFDNVNITNLYMNNVLVFSYSNGTLVSSVVISNTTGSSYSPTGSFTTILLGGVALGSASTNNTGDFLSSNSPTGNWNTAYNWVTGNSNGVAYLTKNNTYSAGTTQTFDTIKFGTNLLQTAGTGQLGLDGTLVPTGDGIAGHRLGTLVSPWSIYANQIWKNGVLLGSASTNNTADFLSSGLPTGNWNAAWAWVTGNSNSLFAPTGTFNYVFGDGAGVSNVNAVTLDGYTPSQLANASLTYYVWGSLAGPFTNPASKMVQLASPIAQGVWTSSVDNVTNGQIMGYASVNTNERPRVLQPGLAKAHLSIVRSGNDAARKMRCWLLVYESDMTTLVNTWYGPEVVVPNVLTHLDFDVSVTNETIITDSNRYIVMYFQTTTGWVGTEDIQVFSQDGELTYLQIQGSAGGIYLTQSELLSYGYLTTNLVGASLVNVGHILPASSNTYDFGSLALPIRSLYLGTNLYLAGINAVAVDSNTTRMVFGRGVRLDTSAVAYDDMLGPARITTSGAIETTWDDALGGVAFSTGSSTNSGQDHITFTYQTPHKKKSDTHLDPHVHFYQTNADQTNCWFIRYAWVGLGQTNVVETFAGPASNALVYTSGTMHQLATFPEITPSGQGISSLLRIKLYRRGTSGTGSITVSDLDCHIEIDGFGSDQELNKTY